MTVKTRFAPSPTGFLHIGGVRTALFSWLYAKKHGGQFVLRIEDTDQERSTKESVDAIIDGMHWLGLDYDEGPVFQTNRYDRYQEAAQWLLDHDHAYYCTCSKERLEALRASQMEQKLKPKYDGHCRHLQLKKPEGAYVIRFKNSESGVVSFKDHVYGDIHVDNQELDDFIIQRSDGHPTYNFAVVIDDWDMKITHVIRGDDHINNTPRQINLYKALGAPVPEFAHLSMILGDDGKRLSKRHGAVSVLQFKDMGILPHALLNYLVRLGWSHGDMELFSLDEMKALFDLDSVSRGAASFSYEKLFWVNQHYMRTDTKESVAKALNWHFIQKGIDPATGPALVDIVSIQAERCKTLEDMCEASQFFYQDDIKYDADAVKKHLRPVVEEPLKALLNHFSATNDWTPNVLQSLINDTCASFDLGLGKVAQPLRVAVTGNSSSPAIDMTLTLLGKDKVVKRLSHALSIILERKENQQQ